MRPKGYGYGLTVSVYKRVKCIYLVHLSHPTDQGGYYLDLKDELQNK